MRWSYLTDVWNYADIVPPIGIIIVVITDFVADTNSEYVNKFRYSI